MKRTATHVVYVIFISVTEYVYQSFFFLSTKILYSVKNGVLNQYAVFCDYFLRIAAKSRVVKELFAFDFFFARDSFAGLVTYRAARFASGLTGASALAASGHFLIYGFCDRLNHNVLLCGVVIF